MSLFFCGEATFYGKEIENWIFWKVHWISRFFYGSFEAIWYVFHLFFCFSFFIIWCNRYEYIWLKRLRGLERFKKYKLCTEQKMAFSITDIFIFWAVVPIDDSSNSTQVQIQILNILKCCQQMCWTMKFLEIF